VLESDFRILGPLEVWHAGRRVDVAGARQRALLSVLLLQAGEVASNDRLIDEVWGDDPPTAGATALRVRISQLRRSLGPVGELLVTRAPGYVVRLETAEQLDLRRFERLVEEGGEALARSDARGAAETLSQALALWRGPPLGDVGGAPFAPIAIARLEELKIVAIELRVEAELALGQHARLVAELRALVEEHPLRERLWGLLMTALYRDGRQADALAAYREARRRLVDEIGLEPGPDLHELERRILAHDSTLQLQLDTPRAPTPRSILVLPRPDAGLERLLALAEPLAAHRDQDLLIAVLVDDPAQLGAGTARLNSARAAAAQRGVRARVAAFTSSDHTADALRLAADEDVALMLMDASDEQLASTASFEGLLADAPCDVALVTGATRVTDSPVMVPFGGRNHDWAALELGAWFARAAGSPLRLVGAGSDPDTGRRDASRLLGSASLALQRALGVNAEPVLATPGVEGMLAATAGAGLVVAGLSDRWSRDGVGAARLELARHARCPVLLVRGGVRPGGLAPPRALTHYTWSAHP
jgi:DNA-binding SARP family transcriptional activator